MLEKLATKNADEDAHTDVASLLRLVGERVRRLRESKKLSRRLLAEHSEVSTRYLVQLESGDGNTSIGHLQRVAIALGQPIESLLAPVDPLVPEATKLAALYRVANASTRMQVQRLLDPRQLRREKSERVCLIGLRGAGKSTLGRLIGKELEIPFVELTVEIERSAGMPTGEIIALYGDEGFRKLEAEILNTVIESRERVVVAVAGGVVEESATFTQLLSRFHAIWIKASPTEHMERVRAQGDLRPMSNNPQAMSRLRQILKTREDRYQQAGYCLVTSGKTVDVSLRELRELIADNEIVFDLARPTTNEFGDNPVKT